MAQKSAVVRANLPDTASGTVDFTSSGLGTVSAAILFSCHAGTSNNPRASAQVSIGFYDGTNTRSASIFGEDNLGTSVAHRAQDTNQFALQGSSATTLYTITAITNGIRLTCDTDNTTEPQYCTAILISGITATVLTVAANATQNSTTTSASLGFEPKLLFALTGSGSGSFTETDHAAIGFGVCRDSDLFQRGYLWSIRNGAGTAQATSRLCDDRMAGHQNEATGTLTRWSVECTTMGADDFTLTTRDGAATSKDVFCLALGGDVAFDCGTLTTPASTGTDAITTGAEPETLMALSSMNPDYTGQYRFSASEAWSLGASDGVSDYCNSATYGDDIGTTNAQSRGSTSDIVYVEYESSGFVSYNQASVDSFNATDFTLDYSVANSGRLGFWVTFDKSDAVLPPRAALIGGMQGLTGGI